MPKYVASRSLRESLEGKPPSPRATSLAVVAPAVAVHGRAARVDHTGTAAPTADRDLDLSVTLPGRRV
jgi:hypothetical protein